MMLTYRVGKVDFAFLQARLGGISMQVKEKPGKPHRAHPAVPDDLQPGHVLVTLEDEYTNLEREVRRFRGEDQALVDLFNQAKQEIAAYLERDRPLAG